MGIDKLKLAGAIKIIGLIIYFAYFVISNTSLNSDLGRLAGIQSDTVSKKNLLSSKCLWLIGGSNVRTGLSAEALSSKSCEAVNLGVNSEAGEFSKYLTWLHYNILAYKVIYSSGLIWSDSPLSIDEEVRIKAPSVSLFSMFSSALFPVEKDSTPFNQFGDLIEQECRKEFPAFNIKTDDYSDSSYLISQEIYKRISTLKEITNSDEIFVRVPPVYVRMNEQAEVYRELMNKRIGVLNSLGVKILGTTIVSTDSSLFCDSLHPNAKGREVFSKEIRFPYSMPDDIVNRTGNSGGRVN